MERGRLPVLAVVLAVVIAGVGFPLAGAAVAQETTATQETDTPDEETAPLGTQLTAFMQHSAAQANDTVEDGMWVAAFERANESAQARMATARAGALGERLERLRDRREALQELRDNGTISQAEYAARASDLNGRIDALQSAINESEDATERAGVNVSALEVLKHNASELTGPQVAGVARGLAGNAGGPPTDVGPPTDAGPPTHAGPPTDVGPPGQGTDDNETDAPPGGGPPGATPGGNDSGDVDDGGDGPGQGEGPPGNGPPGNGPPGNGDGPPGNGPPGN